MTPTPDWTIAVRKPHTSATSHRMIPSTRLSRERRWSRHSRLRGGWSPSIRIRGPHIGSASRIARSMTPRLLALPGSGPLRSCTNGLSKRYDTWRYTDGPFTSRLEEQLCLFLEYHPHVRYYQRGDASPACATIYSLVTDLGTPYRINYVFEGNPHEYLPDYVGTLCDGGLLVAEAGRESEKSKGKALVKAET